jgi:chaperone modulatory protein CbpM
MTSDFNLKGDQNHNQAHDQAPVIVAWLLEEQTEISLTDICRATSAQVDMIVQLVQEGVIEPEGQAPEVWRFTGLHLQRARVAVRLQRDLGVNLAGAALALQLMDEMEQLRAQLRRISQI